MGKGRLLLTNEKKMANSGDLIYNIYGRNKPSPISDEIHF